MTPTHLVFSAYPDSAQCQCGDEPDSIRHTTYAAGYEQAEQDISAAVRAALPEPAKIAIPAWVHGPTRKRWARHGITAAVKAMGFNDKR